MSAICQCWSARFENPLRLGRVEVCLDTKEDGGLPGNLLRLTMAWLATAGPTRAHRLQTRTPAYLELY